VSMCQPVTSKMRCVPCTQSGHLPWQSGGWCRACDTEALLETDVGVRSCGVSLGPGETVAIGLVFDYDNTIYTAHGPSLLVAMMDVSRLLAEHMPKVLLHALAEGA